MYLYAFQWRLSFMTAVYCMYVKAIFIRYPYNTNNSQLFYFLTTLVISKVTKIIVPQGGQESGTAGWKTTAGWGHLLLQEMKRTPPQQLESNQPHPQALGFGMCEQVLMQWSVCHHICSAATKAQQPRMWSLRTLQGQVEAIAT